MEKLVPTLIDSAYKAPLLFIALALLLILGYALWWVTHKLWPQHLEEQQKTRDHMTAMMTTRGKEAAEDAERDRELHKAQNEVIVNRVENKIAGVSGQVADVHERVVGIDDQLRRIALKVGVASLLGLLAVSALLNARRVIVAETCSPPCARGYHCVSGNKCEPDKSTPAAKKAALEPSSVYVAIPHAAVACSPRFETCTQPAL